MCCNSQGHCDSQGHKELDTTEPLKWTELNWTWLHSDLNSLPHPCIPQTNYNTFLKWDIMSMESSLPKASTKFQLLPVRPPAGEGQWSRACLCAAHATPCLSLRNWDVPRVKRQACEATPSVGSFGTLLQHYCAECLLSLPVVVQLLSLIWLCYPMDCSTPAFPVLHYFLQFAQIHVHWVEDAI